MCSDGVPLVSFSYLSSQILVHMTLKHNDAVHSIMITVMIDNDDKEHEL